MAEYTLYHNPRCSKSRQALALLEENGIAPTIVKYLDTPPDAETVRTLVKSCAWNGPTIWCALKKRSTRKPG